MKSLNWKPGLPDWMEQHRRTHNEHATGRTTAGEQIDVALWRHVEPATWNDPEEVYEHWSVYIDKKQIDFNDGGRDDARAALVRILESEHIELEK